MLYTVYCILYTVYCILYTYTVYCILLSVYFILFILDCTLPTVYSTANSVCCTGYSVQYTDVSGSAPAKVPTLGSRDYQRTAVQ